MTINKPGDLQVPARREGASEVEGFGEQGDAHGEVGNFHNTLRKNRHSYKHFQILLSKQF